MIDLYRDISSYSDEELAGISAEDLRQLSVAAEDQALAIYFEHQAGGGAVPADAARRSLERFLMAKRFALMRRLLLRRRGTEAEDERSPDDALHPPA